MKKIWVGTSPNTKTKKKNLFLPDLNQNQKDFQICHSVQVIQCHNDKTRQFKILPIQSKLTGNHLVSLFFVSRQCIYGTVEFLRRSVLPWITQYIRCFVCSIIVHFFPLWQDTAFNCNESVFPLRAGHYICQEGQCSCCFGRTLNSVVRGESLL